LLLPKKKRKRGLINGLGEDVKIVPGNLADADGRRIEDNLKMITENQRELTANATARFDNITDHINKEQQIINYFLTNYKNTIFKGVNSENHLLHALQYISRINLNIDVLSNYLSSLASLVTNCVYLVLCDFCQFVINICVTGALLCDLVQHNQPCLCFKSFVYV